MRISFVGNGYGQKLLENRLLTNSQAYIHCKFYIMLNGHVKRSHLPKFFKVTGRTEEEINVRPKRLHEKTFIPRHIH